MGGAKETPRQKLIGLMYLVLMALLAMNVSKEVINAFVTINNNMEDQNKDLVLSNLSQITELNGKLNSPKTSIKDKEELKLVLLKAENVHELSRETVNFLIEEANSMLNEGQKGDWIEDGGDGFLSIIDLVQNEYDKKDDYDIPTRIFVGDDHQNITQRGKDLVKRIEDYRDSICINIASQIDLSDNKKYYFVPPTIVKNNNSDTSYIQTLNESLETVKLEDRKVIKEIYSLLTLPQVVTNHGEDYPWQAGQFDHAPMVAAVAIFTSLKGKVLQAEKMAMDNFNTLNDVPMFKFNTIKPLAFSKSSYINVGDSLDMSVMVAAFDSTLNTEVRYWIDDTLRQDDKMLISNLNEIKFGGGVGEHIIVGDIAVQSKNGKEWKPFEFNYSVGAPNATISASALNVLYANGWDNEIEVSAGGFDPSSVSVSGSNCQISKIGDKYIVKATKVNSTASINVSALDSKGNKVNLSSKEFRIKPLPKPQPIFAGKTFGDNKIPKANVCGVNVLAAGVLDGILDVKYEVKSFKLIVISGGKMNTLTSNSKYFTDDMKQYKCGLGKGQKLILADIKASINGEEPVPIGDLSFTID